MTGAGEFVMQGFELGGLRRGIGGHCLRVGRGNGKCLFPSCFRVSMRGRHKPCAQLRSLCARFIQIKVGTAHSLIKAGFKDLELDAEQGEFELADAEIRTGNGQTNGSISRVYSSARVIRPHIFAAVHPLRSPFLRCAAPEGICKRQAQR